jgi:hypothetical protein
LGKTYAIKVWWYWEHIENFTTSWKPLETWWEHKGNRLRAKKKPKIQHLPTQSINKFMGAFRIFIFIFEQANIDWPRLGVAMTNNTSNNLSTFNGAIT